MKHQALLSSKDKSSAAILLGALRVNAQIYPMMIQSLYS